jgi:MoxR-like ATPase
MMGPKFENLGGKSFNNPDANKDDREALPIHEDETSLSYLGVRLEKAKEGGSQFVPKREQYEDYINDRFSAELQKKIAISFASGDPILIEGGTSIGKTTTIKKMCSELGWEVHYANLNGATDVEDLMGRYIPNPNRTHGTQDAEYIFADGKITSGLRQEEKKIKVIILDELNATAPNILIRLHEVLDSLERGGDVILSEDASEAVKTNKEKTKVIALMNPPGKGYFGREPLDPAQLRRWVYQKEVTDLPGDTFSNSTDALFNLAPKTNLVSVSSFITTPKEQLSVEQLTEIPGIEEITAKYKEFHKAAKEMLKQRNIAEDQPQPFMYDDRMEPKRVRDYVLRFYSGDINKTFQEALEYYYANKLESVEDRDKLRELIRNVECKPQVRESKRKGLEVGSEDGEKQELIDEINAVKGSIPDWLLKEAGVPGTEFRPEGKIEGSLMEQIKIAKEILGAREVMGPNEVEKAFGIRLESKDIPAIPFSKEELKRAKELGQFLVLRTDKAPDGEDLTMIKMHKMLEKLFADKSKGKVLYDPSGWKASQEFFVKGKPEFKWALTSKELIPNTTSKDYLAQTEEASEYLKNQVFKGVEMPKEYKEAILELDSRKDDLRKLLKTGDKSKYEPELSKLKINRLIRQSPAETMYDILMYFQNNNERLLEGKYTWTHAADSDGARVRLGGFVSDGLYVHSYSADHSYSDLGVVFSRKF